MAEFALWVAYGLFVSGLTVFLFFLLRGRSGRPPPDLAGPPGRSGGPSGAGEQPR